jgi:hypothetical protein
MAAPRLQLKRGTTAPGSIFYEAEPIVRYNSGITELHIGDAGGTGTGAGTIVASESAYAAVSQMLVAASSAGSGEVRIYEDTDEVGSNFVTLKVPALAASYILTLPENDGDNGQFLTTNGSGLLSWTTASITSFTTFAVGGTAATSGTDNIVADTSGDTFTFAEGEGINLFTNATTDTLTISAELASTTNPGVASFAAADFDVSVGGEVTIAANAVALGTDTTGDYVATVAVTANGGISTTGAATGEGIAHSLALDIDGMTDIGTALADADLIAVDDGGAGTNRKAAVTRVADYTFSKVSGDITIAAGGAATIAANSVALGTDTTGNYVATITTSATGGLTGGAAGSEGTAITLELKNNANLTNNTVLKWNATADELTNGIITDDGSTVTIGGNLTVNGTTTTVNTTNTVISDALIELANGSTGAQAATRDSGIVIERGTDSNIFFGYDEGVDVFVAGTTTATGATNGDVAPTPIAFLAGAFNVTDTAGTNQAIVSYLAADGLFTGAAAGRYLQNVTVDCGVY